MGWLGAAADRVANASKWNVRTGLKYEWQTSTECGQWDPFDPASFCEVMKRLGGLLLLAGDSLTTLMQNSLHNLQQINFETRRDDTVAFSGFVQILGSWEPDGGQVEAVQGSGAVRTRAPRGANTQATPPHGPIAEPTPFEALLRRQRSSLG